MFILFEDFRPNIYNVQCVPNEGDDGWAFIAVITSNVFVSVERISACIQESLFIAVARIFEGNIKTDRSKSKVSYSTSKKKKMYGARESFGNNLKNKKGHENASYYSQPQTILVITR